MKIGNIHIDSICALAPMAGFTDRAFREICTDFGAGLTVTEMVSVKALRYGDKKSIKLMELSKDHFPHSIQLFGNDSEDFAYAIDTVLSSNPDIIDINMGCPMRKIVSQGSGCALMTNPKMCYDIVKTVKNTSKKSVTVKLRKEYSDNTPNAVEIAQVCEQAGADAICIHGRTKNQLYSGKVDLDIIQAVKRSVNIPVIGNGDIKNAKDAAKMLETTGCDMIMVGRGALGNPFIFREINTYLKTGQIIHANLYETIYTMLKHIQKSCVYKNEKQAIREARKHICYYTKGLKYSATFRNCVNNLSSFKDLEELSKVMLEKLHE